MPDVHNHTNMPNWAPRQQMIVTDKSLLSSYWKAKAIRSGIQSKSGTLQGLGGLGEDGSATPFFAVSGGVAMNQDYLHPAGGDTMMPASTQSVDSFLDRLNATVQGVAVKVPGATITMNPRTNRPEVPWWQIGLGAVAVIWVARKIW